MGGKFKFQAEIWRFEKHVALSEKKSPLDKQPISKGQKVSKEVVLSSMPLKKEGSDSVLRV